MHTYKTFSEVYLNRLKKNQKFGVGGIYKQNPDDYFYDHELMGTQSIGGKKYRLYTKPADGGGVYLYGVNDSLNAIEISVYGELNTQSKTLENLYLTKSSTSTLKAHLFYRTLIVDYKFTLKSNSQSYGAVKVWKALSKFKDVNIYGWKDGKAINVDIKQDDEVIWADDVDMFNPDFENFDLVATRK